MLTPRSIGDVVADAIMTRAAAPKAAILLVEGVKDERLMRPRCRETTQIIRCDGKTTLKGSLARIESVGIRGVVALEDDDGDSLLGTALDSANLIRTASRDSESMLLSSPAFEAVATELAQRRTVPQCEAALGSSLRDSLVNRCLPLGRLRFIDKMRDLGVPFDRLSPHRYMDNGWTFNEDQLLKDFVEASGLAEATVMTELQSLPLVDSWKLIHGKDAIWIFWLLNASILGGHNLSQDELTMMLRLAYLDEFFALTTTFHEMKQWQESSGFLILK